MKVFTPQNILVLTLLFLVFFSLQKGYSQSDEPGIKFGGSLNVGFTNNRLNIAIAPAAIYQFNEWFGGGVGLNFGYSSFENDALNQESTSTNYGGSVITLFSPFPELQLSAEFEEMGVSRTTKIAGEKFTDDYWYPALFVGAGYRTGPVSVGLRYDLLYDDQKSIYGSAYAPFVRVFF
ncbi:alpha-ketoglutarate decarboxylase [Aquimarina mytili]|uniref:Alpha-ketoglutarate decarboxylase n=1 Tax=Aquimarina mytili TaxID=874423 RepID=A0A936ZXL9_9FLAO|nr:alpha-ketoglutarate decarboxylase [Aquimarina mytili]MBL0683790.1 alpha-ketoglutarate decarboxylase [Aquimarina mytili]